jgi:GMP synthase (glutamine-hydrolysing)
MRVGAPAKIVILRAGDVAAEVAAVHGEFAGLIRAAVGDAWRGAWSEHDLRTQNAPSIDDASSAFIVTGSSSSVTERAPWMLRAEEFLRAVVAREIPLFGICFGHQLIAQALGGLVAKNPHGREIGTVKVRVLEKDPIWNGLATSHNPREITVNGTHVDAVVRLPENARLLATTNRDPYAAFAFGKMTRCVQFHPEMNGDVMRGYIKARAPLINAEGLDADAIYANAVEAPEGIAVLKNFVASYVTA